MKSVIAGFWCVAFAGGMGFGAEDSAPVISRVMTAADRDHDGKLSLAEYLPLDVQAVHHGKEHFEAGDKNHDHFLDTAELDATLRKQTWYVIQLEGVDACFKRLDADHNGSLSLDEYRKISRMPQHAQQHFKKADVNHDNALSPAEFAAHADELLSKPTKTNSSQESKP
jgi:Ca2+-binding EF-hand superfamily protein